MQTAFVQSDQGIHISLIESIDSVEYIDRDSLDQTSLI